MRPGRTVYYSSILRVAFSFEVGSMSCAPIMTIAPVPYCHHGCDCTPGFQYHTCILAFATNLMFDLLHDLYIATFPAHVPESLVSCYEFQSTALTTFVVLILNVPFNDKYSHQAEQTASARTLKLNKSCTSNETFGGPWSQTNHGALRPERDRSLWATSVRDLVSLQGLGISAQCRRLRILKAFACDFNLGA